MGMPVKLKVTGIFYARNVAGKECYFYIRFVMPMIFLKMSEFGMALVGFLHVIFMLKIKG